MLARLWQQEPEKFRQLSTRAAAYFANRENPVQQIEWLYHLSVADAGDVADFLWNYTSELNDTFRFTELDALASVLFEQAEANRVSPATKAVIYYRKGGAEKRVYRSQPAMQAFGQALNSYRDIGDRLGEANCLYRIADVQQFLNRREEALGNYDTALALYRDIGDRLGEANCLKAIADVQQFLKRSEEALGNYDTALALYRDIGDRLGEANCLQELGKFQDEWAETLKYWTQAQELYEQIGDKYSQSRNLLFVAQALRELERETEAVDALERAATLAEEIGYAPFQDYARERLAEIRVSQPADA
jgi:tetratricopeptide (TPR) repeat protein